MPKPDFQFKQFAINHDKCAMKVNTDGILLGAWANTSGDLNILDVGTGTGLIALMLAQRTAAQKAQITAVELDNNAALQANENVEMSPWPDRVTIINADFSNFQSSKRFDHIVSNPPFFSNSLQNNSQSKTNARHQSALSFDDLLNISAKLVIPGGKLSVVLPIQEMTQFESMAQKKGWQLTRKLSIRHGENTKFMRQMVELSMPQLGNLDVQVQTLVIRDKNGDYTTNYKLLCRDFYLKF